MPSSVIAHMNYDETRQVLHITFVSGRSYDYLSVPAEEYAAMKKAFSKGIYFNSHVKGKYRFRKIK